MTREGMNQLVREAVLATGRVKELTASDDRADLATLGLDSMAALDLIAEVEDRLGVVVDDRRALHLRTIEAIAAYLLTLIGSGSPADPSTAAPSPDATSAHRPLSLSVATHPFLASHELLGRMVLPLAMAQEFLVEAFCGGSPPTAIRIDDLEVERPLVVPADGEAKVRLELVPRDGGVAAALRREDGAVFVSCRMAPVAEPGATGGPRLGAATRTLSPELYDGLLPHGEHFHCSFGLCRFDAEGIVAHVEEQQRDRPLIAGRAATELRTRPVLVDGLLQACGLHALRLHGKLALPTRVARIHLDLDALNSPGSLSCHIRRVGAQLYEVRASSADGRTAVELLGLELSTVETAQADRARERLERLLLAGGFTR